MNKPNKRFKITKNHKNSICFQGHRNKLREEEVHKKS